jgi:cytochrome c peroxidase
MGVSGVVILSGRAGRNAARMPSGMLTAFRPALPDKITTPDTPITEEKVDLGRKLFYDKRFSKNHDISCNTCHDLQQYGIDPRDPQEVSLGHRDQRGGRNSPTVYNAAGHIAQFWDGRSPNVEHQARQPVRNPVEMAMPSEDYVMRVIESIPGYVEAFKKAFPEDDNPVSYENFGEAIGAFERGLTTPAPWDKFLEGDEDALTDKQKQGFQTFLNTGCLTCHQGTYLGGQMYQKVGLVEPWPNQEDLGRYEVTGKEEDKMKFKVPSLRNILKTGPYFHDGSVEDLDKAILMMAKHQLGRQLGDSQVEQIKAFFSALTGEIPEDYIEKPELPESGPDTPEPDPSPTKANGHE